MKKTFLACISLFALWPLNSMASVFDPYTLNYTLNVNGASGTLTKTQLINGNNYNITSSMTVSKLWITKTIVQQVSGTFDAYGNISPQNYSVNNNGTMTNFSLQQNQLDPLSLVLWLSDELAQGMTTFPAQSVLYNQNNIIVSCALVNQAELVSNISCPSSDNSVTLNYLFDQNQTLVAVAINENGSPTLSASLNNG